MSGWQLSLIGPPPGDLDAAAMSAIAGCSDEATIARIPLPTPRSGRVLLLGDLFRLRRHQHEQIVISGDVHFLHRLGYEWATGSLLVEGDVGEELGTRMRSGAIEVRGNTASRAACQMRGGVIRVSGNTGDDLGCPLPGLRSGMRGGRVVIAGTAGHHAGHRMRRGTVLILGDCGHGVGSDMVAGTIAVGGNAGNFAAAGMKRGTLILARPAALDTIRFVRSRFAPLAIAQLFARDMQSDAPQLAKLLDQPLERFLGDRSAGGQGELWQASRPTV